MQVAVIEHRENDYARIVRCVDVGEFPHGTKLFALKDAEAMSVSSKPKSVRSKVRCTSVVNNTVCFSTVYEVAPPGEVDTENARFTKATPWGDIRMGIDNPDALEQFQPNKEYYVDFTPAS